MSPDSVVWRELGTPALMKLTATFPLERCDIPAFGQWWRPASIRSSPIYYDRLSIGPWIMARSLIELYGSRPSDYPGEGPP